MIRRNKDYIILQIESIGDLVSKIKSGLTNSDNEIGEKETVSATCINRTNNRTFKDRSSSETRFLQSIAWRCY